MTIALTPFAPIRHPLARVRQWLCTSAVNRVTRVTGQVTGRFADAGIHSLQRGEMWTLSQPAGSRLECLGGTVWITHDGDCKDLVLEAGQTYLVDRSTRMIAYALKPAQFRVQTA